MLDKDLDKPIFVEKDNGFIKNIVDGGQSIISPGGTMPGDSWPL